MQFSLKFMCICPCVYMPCMYRCSQGPEMGTGPSGTAVTSSCEQTNVGAAVNQTEVI